MYIYILNITIISIFKYKYINITTYIVIYYIKYINVYYIHIYYRIPGTSPKAPSVKYDHFILWGCFHAYKGHIKGNLPLDSPLAPFKRCAGTQRQVFFKKIRRYLCLYIGYPYKR